MKKKKTKMTCRSLCYTQHSMMTSTNTKHIFAIPFENIENYSKSLRKREREIKKTNEEGEKK